MVRSSHRLTDGRQTPSQRSMMSKLSEATRHRYYRDEFYTLGAEGLEDGGLDGWGFLRLMTLLGLPQPATAAEALWRKYKKADGSRMTVNQYISLMMNPEVDAKTDIWRKLFAQFDTEGKGYASRQAVQKGLTTLGIEVGQEMKDKIRAMDSDNDDRINYGDFLKMQLLRQ